MYNLNEAQKGAVDSKAKRLLILAGAGTGKTATMISKIQNICETEDPTGKSILALTFTNAAAFEMKQRFRKIHKGNASPEFRTFHGFCYSLLCHDAEVRQTLGFRNVPAIADEGTEGRAKTKARLQVKCKLSNAQIEGKVKLSLMEEHQLKLYKKALYRILYADCMITFDVLSDLVCGLFISNDPCIKKYQEQYKYIFIDEFQDTSPDQWKFAESFKDSNIIVIGDALQCQPAGTLVTMSDMTVKPIESIVPGDCLLTYSKKDGRYIKDSCKKSAHSNKCCKQVNAVASRYADNIVEICSKHHSSKYTKDHITYAKIHHEGNESAFVSYLMNNDDGWWRVGSTKLFISPQGNDFGPKLRLKSEYGKDIWILGVYRNQSEARIAEEIISCKFGIPQISWEHTDVKFYKDNIKIIYDELGDLSDKAKQCLEQFGADIEYPFMSKYECNDQISKSHMFITCVGKLVPKIMDIVIPEFKDADSSELHNKYEQILEILPQPGQTVYSLDVQDNHNYVADGILTHNCIYAFRGANSDIIKQLSTDPEWEVHKLYQNYRSSKQICDFANNMSTYADDSYRIEIESDRSGKNVVKLGSCAIRFKMPVDESSIQHILKHLSNLEGTTAILARTNAEVDEICKYLEDNNISCNRNHSKDESSKFLDAALDTEYAVDWLASYLNIIEYADYIRLCEIHDDNRGDILFEHFGNNSQIKSKLMNLDEIQKLLKSKLPNISKVICILNILDCRKLAQSLMETDDFPGASQDVIEYCKQVITQSNEHDVYVGTIHSVKGLEYDNVYLIGVNDISFRLDTKDDQNMNLYYVGITRARNNLTIFYRKEPVPNEIPKRH